MADEKTAPTSRPVIVTTSHKGVFFGHATDTTGDRIHLSGARMVIYWGGTKGFMRLAETGPESGDKISAKADIEVRGVTSVAEVTPDALSKWEAVK
jgi:hypothetical protein